MGSSTNYDAIVIGAGHNGLVTANYLAKAGRKVLVLERRDIAGGQLASESWGGGEKDPKQQTNKQGRAGKQRKQRGRRQLTRINCLRPLFLVPFGSPHPPGSKPLRKMMISGLCRSTAPMSTWPLTQRFTPR